MIPEKTIQTVIADLTGRFGQAEGGRIRRCVPRAAALWRAEDGTPEQFAAFCSENYLPAGEQLDAAFARFEGLFEQVSGHLHEVQRLIREPLDLDRGPIRPLDMLLGNLDLSAHLPDDLFRSKASFAVLLNFPVYTLEEMLAKGPAWSREEWARARLAQGFSERVPAEVNQRIHEAFVAADNYINRYNILMGHLLAAEGRRPFPADLRLISHWGLRDELKSQYGETEGLERQRLIRLVMERIIRQEIPAVVVDNLAVDWDPAANQVFPAAAAGIQEGNPKQTNPGAPATGAGSLGGSGAGAAASPPAAREEDERYRRVLEIFRAVRSSDPYYPDIPSFVDRRFQRYREIPEEQVRALFLEVLASPEAARAGRLIARRLGRPLEPFDIWYDGFKSRGAHREEELSGIVRQRYNDVAAFQQAIPEILGRLGFAPETASFLGSKIVVDPARGAGHAMGAERREDAAHLRTRVPAGGMDYKGYNIAMHELGHTVEQVFSLNRIDHNLLQGVPNTAFTEAFAFVFQDRDLEMLGLGNEDPLADHLQALDTFWSTYEIAGVALVDIGIWHWMYEHPEATPAELREAVLAIARDVWNRYYAPVFGQEDQILLAVYSHMIDSGLYLPDYPLGHIISFQIESHLEGKSLGQEMERMCLQGALTPDAWMRGAVGSPVSATPLVAAAREALEALEKE